MTTYQSQACQGVTALCATTVLRTLALYVAVPIVQATITHTVQVHNIVTVHNIKPVLVPAHYITPVPVTAIIILLD